MNYFFVDLLDIHGGVVFVGGAQNLGGAQAAAEKHAHKTFHTEISQWSGKGPWHASPIGIDKTYRICSKDVSSQ